MTVYEWINSKNNVIINFNKYIDGDYIEILEIKMDIHCEWITSNDDRTLTFFPITAIRTFYSDQIPQNDIAMIAILDQMYEDLTEFFDKLKKYKTK